MPNAESSSSRSTHSRIHIRNAHEAHTLFEAVRLGLLPIVRRRLSPTDRELQSGEVFVWEEASYKGGLERWTDGRKWSQSRMREPFLFYEEKALPSREERDAKAARRATKSASGSPPPPNFPDNSSTLPTKRQDRPTKLKGLTKQTYSAYVSAPGSTGPPKKWHLTAYFCSADYNCLPTVETDTVLSKVVVPPDVYVTGKGLTRKNNTRGVGGSSSSSNTYSPYYIPPIDGSFESATTAFHSSYPTVNHMYPPTPTPQQSYMSQQTPQAFHPPPYRGEEGSRSPSSDSSSNVNMPLTPPPMLSPSYHHTQDVRLPSPHSPEQPKSFTTTPPHLSSRPQYTTSDIRGQPQNLPPLPQAKYAARHTLDQRALGAFRITL